MERRPEVDGGRPSGTTRPLHVAVLRIDLSGSLLICRYVNKMLSNAVEALYIFDQHKSVSSLLSCSCFDLSTDIDAVNPS